MKRDTGFSIVEGLLIIVIVAAVGAGGWLVWERAHKDGITPNSTAEVKKEENKEEMKTKADGESEVSKNWKRYTSGQGTFSIKLADGLDGISDKTSDFFIFRTFTSTTGVATVEEVEGFGSDGFFALVIDSGEPYGEPTTAESLNIESTEFVTNTGQKGTKLTYEDPYLPPCEGLGCYLGDKHIVYTFDDEQTGKRTRVHYGRRIAYDEAKLVYQITSDDPDYSEFVDQMVKTLLVN